MYEIKKVNESDFELIKSFLFEVPAIDSIDDEVLKNASVLYLDEQIYGIISYELFFNYALIRYFVFKRNITNNDLYELYLSLENELINKNIDYSIAIINNESVEEVFKNKL